jgi:hypothetical protein
MIRRLPCGGKSWGGNKQRLHRFHMDAFSLKKLKKLEVRSFGEFRCWCWENIREIINISVKDRVLYYECKKHKPWFSEGCLKLLDQRKQAKFQLLQDPSEVNGGSVNNRPACISRVERGTMWKQINGLAANNKNTNVRDPYRGINEFKTGYQCRSNLVKNEDGDLLSHSQNILNRWKNYYSLIECAQFSDVRQKYIHLRH